MADRLVIAAGGIVAALAFAWAITSFSPAIPAALALGVAVAFVLTRYPELGLVLYVTCLGFVDPIALRVGIPEGMRALPFAIILSVILAVYALRKQPAVSPGRIHLIPIPLLLLLLAGLAWTPSPGYGLHKTAAYIHYNVLVFLGTTLFIGDRKRLERIVHAGVWVGLAILVIGGLNLLAISPDDVLWERFGFLGFTALTLARSLGFFCVSALVVAGSTTSRATKTVCVLLVPALMFLIYRTGSRMPTLAVAVCVVVYLLTMGRRPVWQRLAFVALFVVISYGLFSITPVDTQSRYVRVLQDNDPELDINLEGSRSYLYDVSEAAFREHPVTGLGTGGFSWYYALEDTKSYPHNMFLEVASEFGVVGLLVLAAFLGSTVVVVRRLMRVRHRPAGESLLFFWGVLLFILALLNSMTTGDIADNSMIWFASAFLWTAYESREPATA